MTTVKESLVPCRICDEPMVPWNIEGYPQMGHRECMLRSALGGIGHLTDHEFWCNKMHDPDGGKTTRESALLVDQWVHEHGTFTG